MKLVPFRKGTYVNEPVELVVFIIPSWRFPFPSCKCSKEEDYTGRARLAVMWTQDI